MANIAKYLEVVDRLFNNNGLIMEFPEKPFIFKLHKGKITEINVKRFKVLFKDCSSLTYSERGDLNTNADYTINSHSYHFQPTNGSGMHPFRIDLENGDLHANPYDQPDNKFDPSWPDHLYYPNDISLNITEFNLAIALRTSLIYLSYQGYPLVNENAKKYNISNGQLRRQIK